MLVYYYETRDLFYPAQHGFRPHRSTLTAWKQILDEVIYSRDIFEFDLKNFFDNVNLDYVSVQLTKAVVPIDVVKRLYFLNTSSVKVKKPYLLNEFEEKMKKLL